MGEVELVGLADAAVEINLSRERLRQLIHAGQIDGWKKVGNSYGIPREEVDRLKREPRPKPGPKGPRKRRPAPADPPAS